MFNISLELSFLLGLWLQTLCYGIFFVLFIGCLYILIWRRRDDKINKLMLLTAIILFVLATIHLGLSIKRAIDAFILAPSALLYYADADNWMFVASTCISQAQNLVGDGLLAYRCYILWRDWRILILPLFMLAGSTLAAFGAQYRMVTLGRALTGMVIKTDIAPWINSYFAVTLAYNVTVTSLISYIIWKNSIHRKDVWPIIAIVVESAVFYSSFIAVNLVLYLIENNGSNTVFDALCPIVGIVFTTIIVRVGLGRESVSKMPGTGPSMAFAMSPASPGVNIKVTREIHGISHYDRGSVAYDIESSIPESPSARKGGSHWSESMGSL